jgi:transcriptional regulator with XRE-family HTH domain
MIIGQKLKELRETEGLSQGDIERRTGLLRCYTSRVECGHTVPTVETLGKYARALEIPLYKLFYDGKQPPKRLNLPATKSKPEWGASGDQRRELRRFAKVLSQMDDRKRGLLLNMAMRMARRDQTKR